MQTHFLDLSAFVFDQTCNLLRTKSCYGFFCRKRKNQFLVPMIRLQRLFGWSERDLTRVDIKKKSKEYENKRSFGYVCMNLWGQSNKVGPKRSSCLICNQTFFLSLIWTAFSTSTRNLYSFFLQLFLGIRINLLHLSQVNYF